MTDIVTEAETVVHNVVSFVEGEASALAHEIEGLVGHSAVTGEVEAAVTSGVDAIVAKVNDLLGLVDRAPIAFTQIVALAKAAVSSADVDALLVKLKALLAYSGTKTDIWDEIVAVAKAL